MTAQVFGLGAESVSPEWIDELLTLFQGAARDGADHYTDLAFRLGVDKAELDARVAGLFNPEARAFIQQFSFNAISKIGEDQKVEIRNIILESLRDGRGAQETARALRDAFDVSERSARLRTIARTELNRSANWGRLSGWQKSGVVTGKEFIAANDDRVRASHLAADGDVVPVDQPFTKGAASGAMSPPLDPNCVLPGQRVEGVVEAASRMPYKGLAVEVTTGYGERFSVTPNHAVLTDKGFALAGALREGDKLLRRVQETRPIGGDSDVHDAPFIEQVFDMLSSSTTRVGVLAGGFHGDAMFGKGYVDVAVVPLELQGGLDAAVVEQGGQLFLASSHVESFGLTGAGPGDLDASGVLHASACSVGGRDLGVALVGVHSSPFQALRVGLAPEFDARGFHVPHQGGAGDTVLCRERVEALSSRVFLDDVVEVRDYEFSGHVYDLQTRLGAFWCNGFLVKNCRCTMGPVTDLGMAAGDRAPGPVDDEFPGIRKLESEFESALFVAWNKVRDALVAEVMASG